MKTAIALIIIAILALAYLWFRLKKRVDLQQKRVDELYSRKPEIDIEKYTDGIAWYDKEGNMINSTSKSAKKKL